MKGTNLIRESFTLRRQVGNLKRGVNLQHRKVIGAAWEGQTTGEFKAITYSRGGHRGAVQGM